LLYPKKKAPQLAGLFCFIPKLKIALGYALYVFTDNIKL